MAGMSGSGDGGVQRALTGAVAVMQGIHCELGPYGVHAWSTFLLAWR